MSGKALVVSSDIFMSVMELLFDKYFDVIVSKQYHRSLELSKSTAFMRFFRFQVLIPTHSLRAFPKQFCLDIMCSGILIILIIHMFLAI